MIDTRYATAIGRIRVKERFLFGRNDLLRLAEARDGEEAMQILSKTNYAKYITKIDGGRNYQEIIDGKWKAVKRLFDLVVLDQNVRGFVWSKNDFLNIKVLLKAKYLSESHEGKLTAMGTIEVKKLVEFILEEKSPLLPKDIMMAIKNAKEQYAYHKDPQMIDIVLDRSYYLGLKKKAQSSGSSFLLQLAEVLIDLYNIRTFVRFKKMGKDKNFLSLVLADGGSIKKSFFLENSEDPLEEFADRFKYSPYAQVVIEGIEEAWKLDKLSGDHVLSFVKKIKHNPFGIEPLVGYIIAREQEAQALQTIMVGKLVGWPANLIKEKLPETYV